MEIDPFTDGLDEHSLLIYRYFLSHYSDSSLPTYKNSFRRIFEWTGGKPIADLVYNDFVSVTRKSETSIFRQIFKFLFAFDCLNDPAGFKSEFGNPESYKNSVEKRKKELTKKEYTQSISIIELNNLIRWADRIDDRDFDNIKLAFCFHMLFFEGLSVNGLKNLDAKYFEENFISPKDSELEKEPVIIPNKYIPLIVELKRKDDTKFTRLNAYIKTLGDKVGISHLEPKAISKARAQHMIRCPECGRYFLGIYNNWIAYFDYLICMGCYQDKLASGEIKKNGTIRPIKIFESTSPESDDGYSPEDDISSEDVEEYDPLNPPEARSAKIIIDRLVRDTQNIKSLKGIYQNKCQLCGQQLKGINHSFISEGHHIRPYNRTHQGRDVRGNIIVLCPNHHAQFDCLYYAIEPVTHTIHCLDENDEYDQSQLIMVGDHIFDECSLEYMWKLFCGRENLYRDNLMS